MFKRIVVEVYRYLPFKMVKYLQVGSSEEPLSGLGSTSGSVLDHVVIYEPLPPAPEYKRWYFGWWPSVLRSRQFFWAASASDQRGLGANFGQMGSASAPGKKGRLQAAPARDAKSFHFELCNS